MSLIQCCCVTNPCSCSFPTALTYKGQVNQAQTSFYFINVYAGGGADPGSYTLTYQTLPAAIPSDLQLGYFTSAPFSSGPTYVTMPASAWFSGPVPITSFGAPSSCYFYGWFAACKLNVMVIDVPYGFGATPLGAGNNVITYNQFACTPFEMTRTLGAPFQVTGTHGGGDITPDSGGNAGMYTNIRPGLTYAIALAVVSATTGLPVSSAAHGTPLGAALTIVGAGGYAPPAVSWSSSNTAVATIAAGVGGRATITTLSAGSVTFTATVTDPDCTTPTVTAGLTVT